MKKSCGAFFLSWPEAFLAGAGIVGGKGWNLGRLERYGFKIPAGGVLAAAAYRDFIKENDLLEVTKGVPKKITAEKVGEKETQKKLFQIRERIKAGHISPHVQQELTSWLKIRGMLQKPLAVRSSATVEDTAGTSFDGIHESFLNIRGMDNILSAIKGCYASLWTSRAVAYRREMNIIDDEVIPAVVITEMVDAKTAGVAFTCDPRNGREDMVLISANFGLGESVVSGAVDADEYCLDKRLEIIHKKIGLKKGKTIARNDNDTEFIESIGSVNDQALTDEEIRKLGLLAQRVFESLGYGKQHQDIEWVFDGKNFTLVQARPVTALPRYTLREIKNQPDIWSNANYRDAMPMVQSTLNQSKNKDWLSFLISCPFKLVGYQLTEGLKFAGIFQGRAYQNLSLLQWLWFDAFGATPREVNDEWGGHQSEIEINETKPYAGINGCQRFGRLLKMVWIMQKTRKKAIKSFELVDFYTQAIFRKNIKSLEDRNLIKELAGAQKVLMEFSPILIVLAISASFTTSRVIGKVLEKQFPGKGRSLLNAMMAGCGDITSAQHGYRLVEMAEIARGDAAARRFFRLSPLILSYGKQYCHTNPREWGCAAGSVYRPRLDAPVLKGFCDCHGNWWLFISRCHSGP